MAAKQKMKSELVFVQTPEFRASFPALFEAKAAKAGDKAKFGVQMLFQTSETAKSKEEGRKVVDIKPLKDLVRAVVEEKFGTDRTKWPPIGEKAGELKLPFRDGTETGKKDKDSYGQGIVFVDASSRNKPGVVYAHGDPNNGGRPALMDVPSDFYGGCYARAKVNAYFWEYMGKMGVSLGLQTVQKLKDGPRFGNASDATKDFDACDLPTGASGAVPAGAGAGAATDL